jgi:hypothetical protein
MAASRTTTELLKRNNSIKNAPGTYWDVIIQLGEPETKPWPFAIAAVNSAIGQTAVNICEVCRLGDRLHNTIEQI